MPSFSIFASRTFRTLVIMFIIGGGQAIDPILPAIIQVPLLAFLTFLATYFHINPSQTDNAPQA